MSAVCWGDPITIDDQTTIVHATRETRDGRTIPVGALTISEGTTTWTPAFDGTLLALAGIGVGLVASTLGTLAVLRSPPWLQITLTR